MMFDDDSEDLRAVRLGIDAEFFLKSPIGQYVATKAQHEIDEATKDLIKARPDDANANTSIRNRIYVAREALSWILQAAADGQAAHIRIREQEAQQNY